MASPAAACVALAQLLCLDTVVVCLLACTGWSCQALLDRRASLDTLALVWGKVAVGVPAKAFHEDSCCSTELASCRRALGLLLRGFCRLYRWRRYTQARCYWLRYWLHPEEVITLLSVWCIVRRGPVIISDPKRRVASVPDRTLLSGIQVVVGGTCSGTILGSTKIIPNSKKPS